MVKMAKLARTDNVAHHLQRQEKMMQDAQEKAHAGSRRQKVRARQAKKAREDAADIERAVHFCGRFAEMFDKKGQYVGPKNDDFSPAAVEARKRLVDMKAFAEEKRPQLARIQKKASEDA